MTHSPDSSKAHSDNTLDDVPSGGRVLGFLVAFFAVMIAGLFALPTPTEESQVAAGDGDSADGSFAILGVRAFDGEKMLTEVDLLVTAGRIAAVGPGLEIPEGVARIDGAGQTVMPGLIDAHVHSWGSARSDAVRFGVTTMLDHFTGLDEVTAARQDREAGGATDRSDLFSAGTLATVEGGHGTQYGVAVDTVDSVEEVPEWVAARIAEGSDWIKIVVEPGWREGINTLDMERVSALIREAHARDVLAVVHVSRLDDALAVTELGADGLVHVWRDRIPTAAEVEVFKASGIFVIPTLVVAEGMADPSPSMAMAEGEWGTRLSDAQRAGLNQRFPAEAALPMDVPKESVRLLYEAGVPILAGSDAPNPATAMGLSQHRELALLVESGLSPLAALVAGTRTPAVAFKLGGPARGTLEVGAIADLVLVDGDPSLDIAATRRLTDVFKAGRRINLAASASTAEEIVAAAPEETLLSDFEDGLKTRYGFGWGETTDSIRGGASVATLTVTDGALVVTGEIKAGAMFPWAGAVVFPGPGAMEPVDLSARSELRFRVRGDGRTYTAMLFSGDMTGIPPTRTFSADGEWQTVVFALDSFNRADPSTVRGVAFTAGNPSGSFRFELDDVEIR
ncbi:MAG: CIA30 family protein [Acidobacteriota bacterium]